ncbi:MAG TPA: hypothetical protein PK050_08580 [Hyphomonadaceae bacterium]|nr:hypothetical protein [Hyphomonadaceae bacterium]
MNDPFETDPLKTDQGELDAAIIRVRLAVLSAGFRKLRYRLSPDELVTLISQNKTDNQAFDQIEKQQPLFTRMRIGLKRMRHGDNRER